MREGKIFRVSLSKLSKHKKQGGKKKKECCEILIRAVCPWAESGEQCNQCSKSFPSDIYLRS